MKRTKTSRPAARPISSLFGARSTAQDLFIEEQRQAKLSDFVGTLARIHELVKFADIATQIDALCPRPDRRKGGRPPYPTEVLVRMVFLQALYGLSDEQLEYQLLDRRSFQHFCGLHDALNLPDSRTLWQFKQRLVRDEQNNKVEGAALIFDAVKQQLQAHGFIPRGGQMVDASIVQAPITQVTSEQREAINSGQRPEGLSDKQLAHIDQDARWTKKHGKSFYGYKVHANVDAKHKLIQRIKVTPANVDDGNTLPDVMDKSNTSAELTADRGYDSAANREALQEAGLRDGIARKAKVGKAPGKRLKARNATINKKRARVEHVFAGMAQLGGKVVRAMNLARNELGITLKCVAYNLKRWVWLEGQQAPA